MYLRSCVSLLLLGSAVSVAAAVPLHYQGRVLDGTGLAVEGSHDIVVRRFADGTTGLCRVAMHAPELRIPQVNLFGQRCTVSFMRDTWLTVEIDSNGQLSPRQPVGAVPNALTAGRLFTGDDTAVPLQVDPGCVAHART